MATQSQGKTPWNSTITTRELFRVMSLIRIQTPKSFEVLLPSRPQAQKFKLSPDKKQKNTWNRRGRLSRAGRISRQVSKTKGFRLIILITTILLISSRCHLWAKNRRIRMWRYRPETWALTSKWIQDAVELNLSENQLTKYLALQSSLPPQLQVLTKTQFLETELAKSQFWSKSIQRSSSWERLRKKMRRSRRRTGIARKTKGLADNPFLRRWAMMSLNASLPSGPKRTIKKVKRMKRTKERVRPVQLLQVLIATSLGLKMTPLMQIFQQLLSLLISPRSQLRFKSNQLQEVKIFKWDHTRVSLWQISHQLIHQKRKDSTLKHRGHYASQRVQERRLMIA